MDDICWAKNLIARISEYRKKYVQKCESCNGADTSCKSYISKSYFSRPLKPVKKADLFDLR